MVNNMWKANKGLVELWFVLMYALSAFVLYANFTTHRYTLSTLDFDSIPSTHHESMNVAIHGSAL